VRGEDFSKKQSPGNLRAEGGEGAGSWITEAKRLLQEQGSRPMIRGHWKWKSSSTVADRRRHNGVE